MSLEFGDASWDTPDTLEGHSWPTLRQFCIFMENRVGNLLELLRCVEKHDLRVLAISILDSMDCAMARLVMSQADRARELLDLANYRYSEIDILGIEFPEDPNPLATICTPLLRAELNIHYTYPLLFRRNGRPAIGMCVDDVDLALQTLRQAGIGIITESDLAHDDEFF